MTDQALAQAVTAWGEAHRDEMIADIIRIVNEKSVSEPGEGGYAFGTGCRRCADAMESMGRGYGFDVEDDDGYTLSLLLRGGSAREIGILGHLDVVPEGTGWHYEPYRAIEKDGFVIGRGSSDNKGAVIMSLYVMRCLKELGLPFAHTIRLICGFNEEAGMQDVEHYLAHHTPPEYTIVCDGGWAMCVGEKGILTANLTQSVRSGNLLSLTGGEASNSVPGVAEARLGPVEEIKLAALERAARPDIRITREADGVVCITADGKAAHAAFPDGGDNAITKLCRVLTAHALVTGEGRRALQNIAECLSDNYGTGLGIDCEDELTAHVANMGGSRATTCVGGLISLADGVLTQNINVRFAISQSPEALLARLRAVCAERGMTLCDLEYSAPRFTDPEGPVTKLLLDTCHEFLGEDYVPYTMGGGTHARKFPNALPYGPGGIRVENPFGAPHGIDEAVHVDSLIRSMSVYAVALARLDRYFDGLPLSIEKS